MTTKDQGKDPKDLELTGALTPESPEETGEKPLGPETAETTTASTSGSAPTSATDWSQTGSLPGTTGKLPQLDPGRMKAGSPSRPRSHKHSRGWNIGYFIREGFVSIFRHGLMSFAAVCTTVACLLIMGTFSLVAVNLNANLEELEQQNEFLAYIDETLSLEQAQGLESALRGVPNVRDAEFVDRETVLAQFRAEREHENELYDLLPDDTFRHRFRVHVDDLERLDQTVKAVEAVSGIAKTSSSPEVAQAMVAARNVAAGVALILVAILAVVSLFIIANTLRLASFYRRDEIAIMKMCGATNGFIRWPFITEGALLGLFSALLAFGAQWWIYDMLAGAVSAGQLGFLVVLSFQSLWRLTLGAFCGAGMVIGVLGSLLAIRRFLQV